MRYASRMEVNDELENSRATGGKPRAAPQISTMMRTAGPALTELPRSGLAASHRRWPGAEIFQISPASVSLARTVRREGERVRASHASAGQR